MTAIYVWPAAEPGDPFVEDCTALALRLGYSLARDPAEAALAVAPKLQKKISMEQVSAPNWGTLIFHPSILPHRRGPDAIRWAVSEGDRVSGVTWFWADSGLDTGPVCEQEPVVLDPDESPGRAYHTRFRPAGLRALDRALRGFLAGEVRRVPQDEKLASYQGWYAKAAEKASS